MRGGPEEHRPSAGLARKDLPEGQHLQEATGRDGMILFTF